MKLTKTYYKEFTKQQDVCDWITDISENSGYHYIILSITHSYVSGWNSPIITVYYQSSKEL